MFYPITAFPPISRTFSPIIRWTWPTKTQPFQLQVSILWRYNGQKIHHRY